MVAVFNDAGREHPAPHLRQGRKSGSIPEPVAPGSPGNRPPRLRGHDEKERHLSSGHACAPGGRSQGNGSASRNVAGLRHAAIERRGPNPPLLPGVGDTVSHSAEINLGRLIARP
jgi:hypothetical protein